PRLLALRAARERRVEHDAPSGLEHLTRTAEELGVDALRHLRAVGGPPGLVAQRRGGCDPEQLLAGLVRADDGRRESFAERRRHLALARGDQAADGDQARGSERRAL